MLTEGKMKRKIILLVVCIITAFCLCGCTSSAAKSTMELINQIGEVTNDSIVSIEKANRAYDALSEKDKGSVSNYNILLDANEALSGIAFSDKICELNTDSISIGDFDSLVEMYDEYTNLSSTAKEYVNNISDLSNMVAESVVLKVQSYKNDELDNAWTVLNQYKGMLTDNQLTDCLLSIGRWGAVPHAEQYLKEHLKSPQSYSRNSGKISTPELISEDFSEYEVCVTLDFSVDNVFGGEERKTIDIFQPFSIDLDNTEIKYYTAKAKGLDGYYIALGEGIFYSK